MSDKEDVLQLVNACRNGSARAQRKFFKSFYGCVMGVCMRYAGNADEASDMLNEGFLKVFSNLDKYENTGSFEAWLKRVVANAALDYRRKFDKNISFVDIQDVEEEISDNYSVNDAVSKISAKEVVEMLQMLPPTSRTVFNMFVFEGMSHKEISEMLGISENTSAWHVNNSRKRLKEFVKQYVND